MIDKEYVLSTVDSEKIRVFYRFLAKAVHRYNTHDLAKQRLEREIRKIKEVTSLNVPEEISSAERKLTDALFKERKLEEQQRVHSDFHQKLQSRIVNLENKLKVFIENKKQREARIAELESKIARMQSSRIDKIRELSIDFEKVQKLYDEAVAEGADSEGILLLQERIDKLKEIFP